jgi:hypothetical protein
VITPAEVKPARATVQALVKFIVISAVEERSGVQLVAKQPPRMANEFRLGANLSCDAAAWHA